ncbi:hypothetical protein EB118_17780 [bacterium]|nr:hypothetical protein [bacterium]
MNAANLLTLRLTPDAAIHADGTKQTGRLRDAASADLTVAHADHTTVVAIIRTIVHDGIGDEDVTIDGILIATPVAEPSTGNEFPKNVQIPAVIDRSVLLSHERTTRSIRIGTESELLIGIDSTHSVVANDCHRVAIVTIEAFNVPHLTKERRGRNAHAGAELLKGMVSRAKLATVCQLEIKIITLVGAANILDFSENILTVINRSLRVLLDLFEGLGLRPPILMDMRSLLETRASCTLKGTNKRTFGSVGINRQLVVIAHL